LGRAVDDGFHVSLEAQEFFTVRTAFFKESGLGHDDRADHASPKIALLTGGNIILRHNVVIILIIIKILLSDNFRTSSYLCFRSRIRARCGVEGGTGSFGSVGSFFFSGFRDSSLCNGSEFLFVGEVVQEIGEEERSAIYSGIL